MSFPSSMILQIDGSTSDTGWIDTAALPDNITASFNITGSWAGGGNTIALDVSNEPYAQGVARTKYSAAVVTYTANPAAPQGIPKNLGAAIRFRRVGAWAGANAAYIGLMGIVPESTKQGNAA